ncbi:MAG TPA: DUF1440 domain-containing protein [Polyangia bacterium]|nr:DUF1440 domain-containing protein [Polyangia bacterium]
MGEARDLGAACGQPPAGEDRDPGRLEADVVDSRARLGALVSELEHRGRREIRPFAVGTVVAVAGLLAMRALGQGPHRLARRRRETRLVSMRNGTRRTEKSGIATDLALGIAAGAGAGWLMTRATTMVYGHESRAVRDRESAARGGKTASEIAAEKLARLMRVQLEPEQSEKAGRAVHWSIALGAGATYAVLRRRVRWVGRGGGLLFGTLFFLFGDELMNTALGLTPGPRAFPWQAHARGLIGHLVYGAATDAQLRLADRVVR